MLEHSYPGKVLDGAEGADEIKRTASGRVMQDRALRTREGVLLAAASVFERVGYSAATIEEIAQEAEVTKGALYFHFPAKADLARAIVEAHHLGWAEVAEEAAQGGVSALDTLWRTILAVALRYQENPIARAGVRLGNEYLEIDASLPAPFTGWVDRLSALLRRGQEEGSVRADLECDAAARVVVGSFFGIQDMSSRLTCRKDLIERIAEWWALIEPSLKPLR
jgi:AcrR family transcriptional regulator